MLGAVWWCGKAVQLQGLDDMSDLMEPLADNVGGEMPSHQSVMFSEVGCSTIIQRAAEWKKRRFWILLVYPLLLLSTAEY